MFEHSLVVALSFLCNANEHKQTPTTTKRPWRSVALPLFLSIENSDYRDFKELPVAGGCLLVAVWASLRSCLAWLSLFRGAASCSWAYLRNCWRSQMTLDCPSDCYWPTLWVKKNGWSVRYWSYHYFSPQEKRFREWCPSSQTFGPICEYAPKFMVWRHRWITAICRLFPVWWDSTLLNWNVWLTQGTLPCHIVSGPIFS